ncbi:hypothetical protein SUGI_0813480 [Cryptomeria japonica]|nr:hypothetical protein SUGI_0813480 [Cryptomeria japonica]
MNVDQHFLRRLRRRRSGGGGAEQERSGAAGSLVVPSRQGHFRQWRILTVGSRLNTTSRTLHRFHRMCA